MELMTAEMLSLSIAFLAAEMFAEIAEEFVIINGVHNNLHITKVGDNSHWTVANYNTIPDEPT